MADCNDISVKNFSGGNVYLKGKITGLTSSEEYCLYYYDILSGFVNMPSNVGDYTYFTGGIWFDLAANGCYAPQQGNALSIVCRKVEGNCETGQAFRCSTTIDTVQEEYCQQDFRVTDQNNEPVKHAFLEAEDQSDFTTFDIRGHGNLGTDINGEISTLHTISDRTYKFYITEFPSGYESMYGSIVGPINACTSRIELKAKKITTGCPVNLCAKDHGTNVPGVRIELDHGAGDVYTQSSPGSFGCTGVFDLACETLYTAHVPDYVNAEDVQFTPTTNLQVIDIEIGDTIPEATHTLTLYFKPWPWTNVNSALSSLAGKSLEIAGALSNMFADATGYEYLGHKIVYERPKGGSYDAIGIKAYVKSDGTSVPQVVFSLMACLVVLSFIAAFGPYVVSIWEDTLTNAFVRLPHALRKVSTLQGDLDNARHDISNDEYDNSAHTDADKEAWIDVQLDIVRQDIELRREFLTKNDIAIHEAFEACVNNAISQYRTNGDFEALRATVGNCISTNATRRNEETEKNYTPADMVDINPGAAFDDFITYLIYGGVIVGGIMLATLGIQLIDTIKR